MNHFFFSLILLVSSCCPEKAAKKNTLLKIEFKEEKFQLLSYGSDVQQVIDQCGLPYSMVVYNKEGNLQSKISSRFMIREEHWKPDDIIIFQYSKPLDDQKDCFVDYEVIFKKGKLDKKRRVIFDD